MKSLTFFVSLALTGFAWTASPLFAQTVYHYEHVALCGACKHDPCCCKEYNWGGRSCREFPWECEDMCKYEKTRAHSCTPACGHKTVQRVVVKTVSTTAPCGCRINAEGTQSLPARDIYDLNCSVIQNLRTLHCIPTHTVQNLSARNDAAYNRANTSYVQTSSVAQENLGDVHRFVHSLQDCCNGGRVR